MENIKKMLVRIVGEENVFDDDERLCQYSRDDSFANPMKPWFIVRPQNAKQVEELIKMANETQKTLIPVSSGAPHYRGDTVPTAPQSIIVDMSKMNKILNINRQQRMVVVEPGVTYEELIPALAAEGMTLSMPIAPKPNKSVIGSVLEIEPRLNSNHQWMYADPFRCAGVTWGDGNSMYTGDAALGPMNLSAQWTNQKWQSSSSGPQMLDFFRLLTMAQGTMGIVSWASLKCEVLPTIHNMYFVPSETSEALQSFVYKVLKLRFSDELFVVNKAYLASLLGETQEEIIRLRESLPNWSALVGIAGRELLPEERVEAQQQDISDFAEEFGLVMSEKIAGISGALALNKSLTPTKDNCFKARLKGGFQDIFFITTLDKTPAFIEEMHRLAIKDGIAPEEIGIYIQPQHGGTSVHLEFSIPYDPLDEKEKKKAAALYQNASVRMSELGAFYARPYDIWSHLQLNKDAQSYSIIKQLKGIFDPNNILNTGKLTI